MICFLHFHYGSANPGRIGVSMMLDVPSRNFKRVLTTLAAGVVLVVAGCGLGDYEALLKEQSNRAKTVDDERKLLGEPLELPAIKLGDTTAPMLTEARVFLRPPKVFQCNPTPYLVGWDKYVPPVAPERNPLPLPKEKGERFTQLYGYKGEKGCNVFLAAVVSDNLKATEAERAAEVGEFQRSVWAAFLVYLKLEREPPKAQKVELQPPRTGRVLPPPLRFDLWILKEDPNDPEKATDYYLYFYRGETTDVEHVAALYQIFPAAKTADPAFMKEVEASLKSLAFGPQGELRRYEASKNR
jgi:hypothetical protein